MKSNFYLSNRQKLLFIVEELHQRGFEKLRVMPSESPSGSHWRCSFIDEKKNHELSASNWISYHEGQNSKEELKLTTLELTDLFVKENFKFLELCKGQNNEYAEWYSGMLKQLDNEEVPYTYLDWKLQKVIWKTLNGKKIETSPSEGKYYL
jgi:hypothetical protein